MRVQAFITSGILEKYVLGMANEEEVQEVLDMASQHIEIKEELAAIRKTLQGYILAHQVRPPVDLREKSLTVSNKRVAASTRNENKPRSNYDSPRSYEKKKESSGSSIAGILAGIFGLGLLAAAYMAYSYHQEAQTVNDDLTSANDEISRIEQSLVKEQQLIKDLQNKLGFYHDRDNKIVVLKGTRRSPDSEAIIFWNSNAKIASVDLPVLPNLEPGKVAVLWVNTDRRSQKVGVLKANLAGERSPLTYVANPTLFYVTEENNADVERPNRARILMTGSL